MSSLKRYRLFQKVAVAIFSAYFMLMVYVTFIAMMRPSGGTGIDTSQMVATRHQVNLEQQQLHIEQSQLASNEQ